MPQPLRGVIFDLDGTLVDSAPDLRNALNAFLAARNRRPLTLAETKAAIGDGAVKLVERALRLTGDCPTGDTLLDETRAYIAIYRTIVADPSQLYPDVLTTLMALRQKSIALGLCTNKPESATRKLLDELALAPYFSGVAGGDTFPTHKPDPAHLHGVITQMGLTPDGCVMVGDSPNDLAAAHGLQVPCILVDYGYAANVRDLPAEATISRMGDLPAALSALGFHGL